MSTGASKLELGPMRWLALVIPFAGALAPLQGAWAATIPPIEASERRFAGSFGVGTVFVYSAADLAFDMNVGHGAWLGVAFAASNGLVMYPPGPTSTSFVALRASKAFVNLDGISIGGVMSLGQLSPSPDSIVSPVQATTIYQVLPALAVSLPVGGTKARPATFRATLGPVFGFASRVDQYGFVNGERTYPGRSAPLKTDWTFGLAPQDWAGNLEVAWPVGESAEFVLGGPGLVGLRVVI